MIKSEIFGKRFKYFPLSKSSRHQATFQCQPSIWLDSAICDEAVLFFQIAYTAWPSQFLTWYKWHAQRLDIEHLKSGLEDSLFGSAHQSAHILNTGALLWWVENRFNSRSRGSSPEICLENSCFRNWLVSGHLSFETKRTIVTVWNEVVLKQIAT